MARLELLTEGVDHRAWRVCPLSLLKKPPTPVTAEKLYRRARGKASMMAVALPRVSGGFLWWIPGRGSILKSHHVGHGCPCPFMAGSGGHNPRWILIRALASETVTSVLTETKRCIIYSAEYFQELPSWGGNSLGLGATSRCQDQRAGLRGWLLQCGRYRTIMSPDSCCLTG